MSRTYILLLCVPLLSGAVFAAVDLNENLIMNGKMNSDQMEVPPFWRPDSGCNVRLGLSSGPGGMPSLKLLPGPTKECAVRQYGLNTSSNGTYLLSFMYKASKAKFRACSIGIAAHGWNAYSGIDLEATDADWKRYEGRVVSNYWPADDNRHFLVFYTIGQTEGSVEFADISLTPADAKTAAATDFSEAAKGRRVVRLVPVVPYLDEIPNETRQMNFRFFGSLPGKTEDFGARFSFGGGNSVEAALGGTNVAVKVPAGCDSGVVKATVVEKASGKELFRRDFDYRVLPKLKHPVRERRLNNLCREIFREKVDGAERTFSFGAGRRAWYYLAFPGAARLDGAQLRAETKEAFRRLEPGDHDLTVSGAAGVVIVRRIAEIYNYCPYHPAAVAQAGKYDHGFFTRHVFPNSTTQCGGYPKPEDLRFTRELGLKYIFNAHVRNLADDDEWLGRLEKSVGMTNPGYDGVSADEVYMHESVNNERVTKSLWRATASKFPEKGVYTWMVGTPSSMGTDSDLLSAAVNSCGGRSRIIYEMYMPSQPTASDAFAYIVTRMRTTLDAYGAYFPQIVSRFGIAFGNFNQYPAITGWTIPSTDYKYYLDMQWQVLATEPKLDGLGLCGYWGSYYADEEMHRWSFLLTRHYVIEGNTGLLSKKHDLSFSGLLEDGDFAKSFAGWTVSEGVRTAREPLVAPYEGRFERSGAEGETYAELPAKVPGRTSSLARTLGGLEVGRLYTLQFCSFDVAAVKAGAKGANPTRVTAELDEGAERIDALCWTYEGLGANKYAVKRPAVNVHHIVFRAKRPKVGLSLTNALTADGKTIGINAVSVLPYVAENAGIN